MRLHLHRHKFRIDGTVVNQPSPGDPLYLTSLFRCRCGSTKRKYDLKAWGFDLA